MATLNPIPTPTVPTKDPITCHILDQTTGKPAVGVKVFLSFRGSRVTQKFPEPLDELDDNDDYNMSEFLSTPPLTGHSKWVSVTDGDGRISKWMTQFSPRESTHSLTDEMDEIAKMIADEKESVDDEAKNRGWKVGEYRVVPEFELTAMSERYFLEKLKESSSSSSGSTNAGAGAVPDSPPTLYSRIAIRFYHDDFSRHMHVPILLSPFGYSTYRGS